jgi:hypothetical protein
MLTSKTIKNSQPSSKTVENPVKIGDFIDYQRFILLKSETAIKEAKQTSLYMDDIITQC